MQLSQYYRNYELPWESDPEDRRRLRRLLTVALSVLVLLGVILPLVHLAPVVEAPDQAVPERLARLMVQPKPKPVPVHQAAPKPEVKPVPKPVITPTPVDRAAQTRRKLEHSGLLKFQDQLADLRRDVDLTALGQTRNLQGAVGQDSHAERSLIASRAASGSGGIVTTASASRGFGSGAGSLVGHQTAAVQSRIAQAAVAASSTRDVRGRPSRSEEEIALVFDRNKGAIYALYGRELRERPDLQGKLVLEFTIAPSGEVTECHVVSSELNDPELERKIVARVKLFQFQARDVATMTTTKPIEFVPTT
ncbi:MAG TPA: TonB family protein [Steroidobacteraceae bacterium]|jgi:TonB family protein|nr:TonB family protein [Steroidobacteraceae bacterium]